MPTAPDRFTDVTQAIQLALAPVFLLTGIAGLLNVMTNGLSRIIDRARKLMEDRSDVALRDPAWLARELSYLEQRRHFTSVAITACRSAALLLCTVIVVLGTSGGSRALKSTRRTPRWWLDCGALQVASWK